MLEMLENWQGSVTVNGITYDNISKIPAKFNDFEDVHIILHAKQKPAKTSVSPVPIALRTRFRVKQYMTKPATPDFDFMAKWNNNVPMPLSTMVGYKIKETRGMVYLKLHGDITAKRVFTCMKCGRELTNPVSQYFGIGPECGGHNYVHPFRTEEELQKAVAAYRTKLQSVTWEGWVIKSAILEEELV